MGINSELAREKFGRRKFERRRRPEALELDFEFSFT